MTDTTIYIGGVAIHEPVTAFTDYFITLMGLYFFSRIRKTRSDSPEIKYWSNFFLFIGLSTLFGGTAHGFFLVHEGPEYKFFWLSTQIINGFAIYYAQKATLASVLKHSPNRKAWSLSYIIQLVLFVVCALYFQKYLVAIIDNAIGLITIMILHFIYMKNEFYFKYIAYGILISFITPFIFISKFTIHAYFNFNDLAHLFIITSFCVMYYGIMLKANKQTQIEKP